VAISLYADFFDDLRAAMLGMQIRRCAVNFIINNAARRRMVKGCGGAAGSRRYAADGCDQWLPFSSERRTAATGSPAWLPARDTCCHQPPPQDSSRQGHVRDCTPPFACVCSGEK